MNISLYLYPYGYISSKDTYGELKCFIKPFTRLETSSNSLNSHQKILQKNPVSWFSIGKLLLIDRVLFSIGRTRIKQWSRHPETPGFFFYHFDRSSQSFNWSKTLYFKFSLRKFQNLNFHFMKQYSPNSYVIITTYPCIYLYIQHNKQKFFISHN